MCSINVNLGQSSVEVYVRKHPEKMVRGLPFSLDAFGAIVGFFNHPLLFCFVSFLPQEITRKATSSAQSWLEGFSFR